MGGGRPAQRDCVGPETGLPSTLPAPCLCRCSRSCKAHTGADRFALFSEEAYQTKAVCVSMNVACGTKNRWRHRRAHLVEFDEHQFGEQTKRQQERDSHA